MNGRAHRTPRRDVRVCWSRRWRVITAVVRKWFPERGSLKLRMDVRGSLGFFRPVVEVGALVIARSRGVRSRGQRMWFAGDSGHSARVILETLKVTDAVAASVTLLKACASAVESAKLLDGAHHRVAVWPLVRVRCLTYDVY